MSDNANEPVEEQVEKGVKKTTRARKNTSSITKNAGETAAAEPKAKPRTARTTKKTANTEDSAVNAAVAGLPGEPAPGKKTAAKGRSARSGKPVAVPADAPAEAQPGVKEPALAEVDTPAVVEAGAPAEETSTVQAESAQDTEPVSRSRRSRSRRGRRKSAARAAAGAGEAPADEAAVSTAAAADVISESAAAQDVHQDVHQDVSPDETDSRSKGRQSKRSRGKQDGEDAVKAVSDASSFDGEADVEGKPAKGGKEAARSRRKMFVSVLPGEQVEAVIAEEGQVQEYYVEMLHQVKIKGNIYKGIIHNVDPNLQAAFVSYGAVKNGFLQIDEVHPEYYLAPHEQGKGHKYPLIQKVLKPGQEILVQVVKEPSGTKGAFLTSYLSLPGRFLVLTPGREQIGVSRKVESEEERSRLRELLSGLNPGDGLGVIVRTVSLGATKTSLQKDLQLLKRVWKDVRKKGSEEQAPSLIYQELGLDTRAVRDYLTEEVVELWVDDEEMAGQIREVVTMLFPRRNNMVQVHKDTEQTLFERFGLKKQLEAVHAREVYLPSGGRLVFDHTEALMAIDINSGRAAGKNNFEDTAFKTNLEAAQQIPLQLRLRDIGGQVVIDFIEMRDRSHWREVEKTIRNGMKIDRARHDVGKISSFGLLEIVRQRLSSSAISVTSEPCPCCSGTGQRRNMEWQSMQALREIRALMRKNAEPGGTVTYCGPEELILYLLNNKKERLVQMEKSGDLKLELRFSLDAAGSCKCK